MLERALYAKQKSRSRHAGFSRFPRRRFAVLNPTCAENARQNASANLKKTTVVHEFLCPRKLRLAAQQMTTVGQTSFLSEETGWPQHLGSGDARSHDVALRKIPGSTKQHISSYIRLAVSLPYGKRGMSEAISNWPSGSDQ
jgi:hypothetical protein